MIVRDIDDAGTGRLPAGLPVNALLRQVPLACGEELLLLLAPLESGSDEQSSQQTGMLAKTVSDWVTAAPAAAEGLLPVVTVPLYGCHVALTNGRAAVVGPPARLEALATSVTEFASHEAELRQLERRSAHLLETLDQDACHAFEFNERSLSQRDTLATRFREAVAVRGQLALLAPAVHAPPVHPPTLASQLAERLRDRTRLAERHEFAVDRVELAERLYEACGQRVADFGIARRQMGLEWAIVVLLLIQTVLLVVDLLAWRGKS